MNCSLSGVGGEEETLGLCRVWGEMEQVNRIMGGVRDAGYGLRVAGFRLWDGEVLPWIEEAVLEEEKLMRRDEELRRKRAEVEKRVRENLEKRDRKGIL